MIKVFLIITASVPIVVVVVILVVASYVLSTIPVDPVKRGIAECIQLYHDTRSDRLYYECFENMENFR